MGGNQNSKVEAREEAKYDRNKVDEAVLALLQLTAWDEPGFANEKFVRAWKEHDWSVLNRLFEKGMILDPRGKSKSVVLTPEGAQASRQLFQKLFG